MSKKMILPTDAMAAAGHEAGEIMQRAGRSFGSQCRWAIYAALNHPDARGLFTDEDARPWEPLVRYHPLNVGDEVRQDRRGISRTAVVGSVDGRGNPWTDEGALIGHLNQGSWWVRHAVQELPPEHDGVVLVPADGHKAITTTKGQEFARLTFTTKQDLWYGPNLAAQPGDWVIQTTAADRLTPGTWKVDDK